MFSVENYLINILHFLDLVYQLKIISIFETHNVFTSLNFHIFVLFENDICVDQERLITENA